MKKSALFLSVLLLVFSSCSTSVQFLSKDQSERIHPDIEWIADLHLGKSFSTLPPERAEQRRLDLL
ncbi:MAG: hypothetical protein PHD63_04555, partial [Candidatus Marinimicrobia bacterium]|nr:hypothetical protein [Candidatus Neomarinimicrobiota bacterium]